MKPIAKKENLFFLGALFALMLAGDLLWWETRQMSDEFDAAAGIYSASVRSEFRDLDKLSREIDAADADATSELNTLETAE